MQPTTRPLPELMWSLGYGGLLPFLALSAALMYETSLPGLENVRLDWWLAAYAAIILSFLGAVHWGVTLGMLDKLEQRESTICCCLALCRGCWRGLRCCCRFRGRCSHWLGW